jgi:hypothetical protein
MNGTANNYLGGNLGIGNTSLTVTNFRISKNIEGGTTAYGVLHDGSIRSGVTAQAIVFSSAPSLQNTAFTLTNLRHFHAIPTASFGSATVTNQFGFYAETTLTGATNNYGFYGDIAAATGRWNFYAQGTALNYFNGNTLIGSTSDTGEKLQVTGTAKITGAATFSSTLNTSDNITITKTTDSLLDIRATALGGTVKMLLNPTSDNNYGLSTGGAADALQFLRNGVEKMRMTNNGFVIGTSSLNASAILQADSTTKGFLLPRMTTTQKNAITTPAAGLMVYDTTLNKLCVYTTAWETITSL